MHSDMNTTMAYTYVMYKEYYKKKDACYSTRGAPVYKLIFGRGGEVLPDQQSPWSRYETKIYSKTK